MTSRWNDEPVRRPLPPSQPQGWVDPPERTLIDDGYLDEREPWSGWSEKPRRTDHRWIVLAALAVAVAVLVLQVTRAKAEEPASGIGTVLIGGTLSYVSAKYGPSYLALPEPRGTVATICGPADCVTRRSTDYGPDQRVHPDRIADLSAADFVRVCGVPLSVGLCRGTVELEPPVSPDDDRLRVEDGGPAFTLPQTDTLTP